jgi:hypothetical protein
LTDALDIRVTANSQLVAQLSAANSQLTAQLSTANSQLVDMNEFIAPLRTTNLTALAAINLTILQSAADAFEPIPAECSERIKWVRFKINSQGAVQIFGQHGISGVRKVATGKYEIRFATNVAGAKYAVTTSSTYRSRDNKDHVKAGLASENFGDEQETANSGGTGSFRAAFKEDRCFVQTRDDDGSHADALFVNVMIVSNSAALTADCSESLEGLHYVVWDGTRNPGGRWAYSPGISVGARDSWGGTPIGGQFVGADSFSVSGSLMGGNAGHYMGLEGSAGGSYQKWSTTLFNPGSRKNGNPQGILRTVMSVVAFDIRLHQAHRGNIKYLSWFDETDRIVSNGGVSAVLKTAPGKWKVIWATPFSDAHYVVTGLANMRCSSGMHLAIGAQQTASFTTIESKDYAGTFRSFGSDCT